MRSRSLSCWSSSESAYAGAQVRVLELAAGLGSRPGPAPPWLLPPLLGRRVRPHVRTPGLLATWAANKVGSRPAWSPASTPSPRRCVRPLRTVHALLEERGGLAMLDDPLMEPATAEIVAGEGIPRHEVQRRIKVRAEGGGRGW